MIDSLNGLRVLLCLMVFVFHVNSQVDAQVVFFRGFGALPVAYFFILSGFVHMYTFNDSMTNDQYKKKTISRIIKNYPIHWLCLFLMIPLKLSGLALNLESIFRLLVNFLLLQSWIPNQDIALDFNGVSWFLSDMIFMIALTVPLCKFVNKISDKRKLFLSIVIIQVIEIILSSLIRIYANGNKNITSIVYFSPLIRILDYLSGIVAAKIFRISQKEYKHKTLIQVCCLLYIILATGLYTYLPESFARAGTLYLIPGTFTIWVLASQHGLVSKFFERKTMVNLSKGTMQFFMVHQVVNINIKAILLHTRKDMNSLIYYTIVVGGGCRSTYFIQNENVFCC